MAQWGMLPEEDPQARFEVQLDFVVDGVKQDFEARDLDASASARLAETWEKILDRGVEEVLAGKPVVWARLEHPVSRPENIRVNALSEWHVERTQTR